MKIEITKNALREVQTVKVTYEFDFDNIDGKGLRELRRILNINQSSIDGIKQRRVSRIENNQDNLTFHDIDNYQKAVTKKINEMKETGLLN